MPLLEDGGHQLLRELGRTGSSSSATKAPSRLTFMSSGNGGWRSPTWIQSGWCPRPDSLLMN